MIKELTDLVIAWQPHSPDATQDAEGADWPELTGDVMASAGQYGNNSQVTKGKVNTYNNW